MSAKNKKYFSSYTDRINGSRLTSVNMNNDEDEEDFGGGDEDSMTELGQIGILSSSRASLRYKSLNELNLSRKSSVISRRSRDARSSKLLLNRQSIVEEDAGGKDAVGPTDEKEAIDDDVYIDDEPLTCLEKLSLRLLPYKGYLFGIMSALSFSASQVTMKRAKYFSGSDHSLVRYLVTFIVMFTVLKYKNLSIFGPRKFLKILLFRGFIGSCALISIYFAIMLINPSDAITIAHSSIIITAILARIFLNEKITLSHFLALILTVIGVLFICKPSFMFNKIYPKQAVARALILTNVTNCTKTLQSTTTSTDLTNLASNLTSINQNLNGNIVNCLEQQTSDDGFGLKEMKIAIGISLTFVSALTSSCVYLVLKKLSNCKVHWASNTIYVCWFGIPFSILISLFLISQELVHKNFEQEKKSLPMDLFYSIMASCLSITGQIFLNISLRYEDATKIALVRTIDVFFSFMLQYLILNIPIDIFSVSGAILIITGTFAVLFFKLLENKYERFKQKQMNKSMNVINSDNKNKDANSIKNDKSIKQQTPEEQKNNISNINNNTKQKSSFKHSLLKFIFVKF